MTGDLPARVGVNAIFLLPGMGGLDTYVQELVPELVAAAPRTRFTVYCSPDGERYLRGSPWASEVRWHSHPLFGVRGLKAICETTLLGALASRRQDLLHSVALTAPLGTRAANVVTIADTTWLSGPRADTTTLLWRALVPPIARRADRLIAISQAGARDIVSHLRVHSERVDVTLLGHRPPDSMTALDDTGVRERFNLGDDPFVLMVGTRKPHKNVDGLLRAFAQVVEHAPRTRLVLAGNPTSIEPELRSLASDLDLAQRVSFLGFVEPAELEGLYAAAACVVLPSHNEGFGLPILEAMGRGVAVACSSASAMPEVGGSAACYFEPGDPSAIARALSQLLSDGELRARLATAGQARAAQLTWRATAEATLESYRRAWAGQSPTSARR